MQLIYDDNSPDIEKKSSNVLRVEYDPRLKLLDVHFKTGRSYRYADVPPTVAKGLKAAASVGGFVYSSVKDHFKVEDLP